tara:strand:+ start:556 stop:870 length:315 start_codon:yes stop_codon:yes gene_type:complete
MNRYLLLSDVMKHMIYYDSSTNRNRFINNTFVINSMRNVLDMDGKLYTQEIDEMTITENIKFIGMLLGIPIMVLLMLPLTILGVSIIFTMWLIDLIQRSINAKK